MNLKSIIESILFVAGRPVSIKELAKIAGQSEIEIRKTIEELKNDRADSGIMILQQDTNFLMSTNPENSNPVKDFLNAELREKLTDAAIETLAIITYKQPVTRAEIEAIRGVNSQYTLRLLLMRGLIERTQTQKDSRVNVYKTTHEFMQHMGIKDLKNLPDFMEITAKVKPPEDINSLSPSPVNTGEGGARTREGEVPENL